MIYGLFSTCRIKEGISYLHTHGTSLSYVFFIEQLIDYCLFEHTCAAMASMVLLRMSPSWPIFKSRLIQHSLLVTLLETPWQASHAASLAWLGLAWLA
jgi:hypothetical protein